MIAELIGQQPALVGRYHQPGFAQAGRKPQGTGNPEGFAVVANFAGLLIRSGQDITRERGQLRGGDRPG